MSDLWQRVETKPTDGSKFFLEEGDNCYFAREYVVPIDSVMPPGTKWHELSPANQLVGNFKKDSSKKDTREWYWKTRAVDLSP